MTHVFFHCSSGNGVLLDQRGSYLDDPVDARDYGERFVRHLISRPGPEDWRDWTLHVSDEEGDELIVVPFASLLGRPN